MIIIVVILVLCLAGVILIQRAANSIFFIRIRMDILQQPRFMIVPSSSSSGDSFRTAFRRTQRALFWSFVVGIVVGFARARKSMPPVE